MKRFETQFQSSIHSVFSTRKESAGAYRYVNNPKVTEGYLESRVFLKCRERSKNKRVLVLCDTTDYNFDSHKNRIFDKTGLGWMGDNTKIGFIQQGLLAIDRNNKKTVCGWAGNHIFSRKTPLKNPRGHRRHLKISQKESYKWIGPSLISRAKVLDLTSHALFVMDREADIYEVMTLLKEKENTDVLIRCQQNRRLKTLEGESVKLYSDIENSENKGHLKIMIQGDRRKRKKRTAKFKVKYKSYTIQRSSSIVNKEDYPEHITMQAVQIKEIASTVPEGEEPIMWRLWTSEPIENLKEAKEIFECYKARWYIEEAFRLLKTEGFDIESSELEKGTNIRKLLLIAMEASVKVMQLKAAREGKGEEKIHSYFEKDEIEFMKKLSKQLEGITEKLKNPYNEESLAFGSWVIARLGGWKGYKSQRPPGTITFKTGVDRFELAYLGYTIERKN